MSAASPDAEENRNFVFTVTTPTLPLTFSQYLLKLIQNHSHYQVIPAPLMLNYDADQMVMTALPLSKNKLIDLTLPLIIADSTGNEVNYLGRYLIYDQRLVGIRLCSSRKEETYGNGQFKKWRFGRINRHRVAKCISDYYKKQKFAEGSYSNEIPIGDFTMTIGDIKVCMLFQSEIQDNQATLMEYKRQGCEIFSIVCDIPRDLVFQANMNITNAKLSTKNENMFRRFIRQNNRLMIYAGARIATKDSLFLANSFIIHPQLPEKCIEPFFFNDGVTLSVLCNVQLFKKPGPKKEKFSESKIKPELHIETNLLSIICRPGKSIKFYANEQIQQTLFSKANGDLLKKMKLWCIYQIDNQKTPFILPIPLSPKMEEIVTQLHKLSQYLGKPLSFILILYKKSKEAIVSEELEESLKVEVYEDFDDLCKKCSHEHLNIYTDDHCHYLHLTPRVESYKRVRLHYDYLKFNDDSGDRKAQVERISKMNDFASHVIKKRIIGYQRLLIQSRSQEWRLSKEEQVQAIAIHLKSKLRSQVNNHPFYNNILFRSTEEIRAAMIEAQAKLANSQTSMADESIFENPPVEEQASVNNENNLDIQLKEMRKSQSKQQKRQNVKCHKCGCLFEKSLLHRCSICRTDICLICIQEKQLVSVKTKQALIETVKCLVCMKLCNCIECLNKDKLELSRNILAISSKSTTNDQQTEKEAIEFRDYCTVCLINQRKSTKIKVSCSTCDRQECLACIRSERKNTTITLEWQCSICKPYVQPPIEPMITEEAMEIQEPARKSKSNSRSASPKKTFVPRREPYNNNNNNRPNNNNNNGNFKSNWNQNRPNNNFNKGNNNSNANDDKKSRSVSRSASPVRKPANKANNEQKKSPSRSNSPKKNVQNNKKNQAQRSPSRSYSKSPLRARNQPAKAAEKKKSPSRSNSPVTPPRNAQKPKQKSPPRSASKSKSPVRGKNNKANEKKRSNSRSVTPPRKPAQKKKSKSRSVSKSKSPPRKAHAAQQRKKSVSRSGSPPKERKNAKKSASKSRSKSRERSRDDNKNRSNNNNSNGRNNQPQPERLWNNDKPRENKWNNNNNNNNSGNNDGNNNYNRDRNQNYQNNRGGYQGNRGRGGYQGNYNRNNDRNNNQGDDSNRRYNSNNSSYNNNRDNSSYKNRDNNRDSNKNNNSGENDNNQLLAVSNFQVNNDVDY